MTVRLPSLSQLIQSETGRAKGTLTINNLREASKRMSVKTVRDFFKADRSINRLLQFPSVLRTKLCKIPKESPVTALCLPDDVPALLGTHIEAAEGDSQRKISREEGAKPTTTDVPHTEQEYQALEAILTVG